MSRVTLGVILGLSIGVADVLLMLPLSFPDKRTALLAAFFSRFSLGFFAATINLPLSPIVVGVLVGLLTSIPDARAHAGSYEVALLRIGQPLRRRGC
jgi:hypothetical protein